MAKRVRVSASEFAEKWNRRLSGAQQDIRRGVENVDESPTDAAADAQDKMRQNLLDAIDNGKWARGLARVSLSDWQDRVLDVGVGRIASGADAAQDDVQAFASELIDHQNAGLSEIEGMADITLQDNINRATAWLRHMAGFERTT